MIPGVRGIIGHRRVLVSGWQARATAPGAVESPAALDDAGWIPADSTAAEALRLAGAFALEGPVRRFDGEDWWFRAQLPELKGDNHGEHALVFEGLATVADVWLDGVPLLTSQNMFLSHERVLPAGAREVVVRCRALDPLLAARRPRPRWRAPMVENQQLRWFRTTLLGRTPGWSPPAPVVGPWRPVVVESRTGFVVDELRMRVQLTGERGRVDVVCRLRSLGNVRSPRAVELVVERNGKQYRTALVAQGERFEGALEVPEPARWWPHTHGDPACYDARLEVGGSAVSLGLIGFRKVEWDNDMRLRVNGVPVFARGACWTPLEVLRLTSDRSSYETSLTQARDAGMNLLRVGGTMVYESDDFYDLCDRLGIMIWQDFMFANMDYPDDDPDFVASVIEEARQLLGRLRARPSVALLCGNSEGEQQAAMWGAPRERWSPRLFHELLPTLVREEAPDFFYWPSSAHGGAFPHQGNVGTTSYYGVGAYLRPLEDARRAEVRFASECLAFANVPEAPALSPSLRVHHAAWKARTPRDLGAGWDFDDVRDHYVERLFRVDPAQLRYADHDRYLALGRVATGEVMAQVFGEWRRARSTCHGGVVWFLRDLWPGAGWGVVDATGTPKAAWHYLRRALQPIAAHISDEGGNGLYLHVTNDRPETLTAEVELACYRAGEIPVASERRPIEVPAHHAGEFAVASWFEGFHDVSYAYRFGPPAQDLVVATVRVGGEMRAQAFHFPVGLPNTREVDVGLVAELNGDRVTLRTRRFAQSLAIEVEGFQPDDAYFHMPPGGERVIALRRIAGTQNARGTVQPLNAEAGAKIR